MTRLPDVETGDVIEIETKAGRAYAQVMHRNPEFGLLVRVRVNTDLEREIRLRAGRVVEAVAGASGTRP